MVDLYLMSKTDRGLWLKESLAGSLPGLRVEGAALEGLASPEGQRFRQDMATRKRARSGIGPCWIMTGCFGGIRDRSEVEMAVVPRHCPSDPSRAGWRPNNAPLGRGHLSATGAHDAILAPQPDYKDCENVPAFTCSGCRRRRYPGRRP